MTINFSGKVAAFSDWYKGYAQKLSQDGTLHETATFHTHYRVEVNIWQSDLILDHVKCALIQFMEEQGIRC